MQENDDGKRDVKENWEGALEYESDGYVPTVVRKQGAFGVGFCKKNWIQKFGPFMA